MNKIQKLAQYIIDNRYPKNEKHKVSDSEMYNNIVEEFKDVWATDWDLVKFAINYNPNENVQEQLKKYKEDNCIK